MKKNLTFPKFVIALTSIVTGLLFIRNGSHIATSMLISNFFVYPEVIDLFLLIVGGVTLGIGVLIMAGDL